MTEAMTEPATKMTIRGKNQGLFLICVNKDIGKHDRMGMSCPGNAIKGYRYFIKLEHMSFHDAFKKREGPTGR
ncbi:MAG: hypothetical protein A4E30_00243 [Methanomassiliicoccales archaeon PtaB.Bin215]|nr:MAG: hypothetical protein A4E30_00243 [Methanomassiliicoccales archaeon PtaB.Bin215]